MISNNFCTIDFLLEKQEMDAGLAICSAHLIHALLNQRTFASPDK